MKKKPVSKKRKRRSSSDVKEFNEIQKAIGRLRRIRF
jgi:hypothetical protein